MTYSSLVTARRNQVAPAVAIPMKGILVTDRSARADSSVTMTMRW
ncbi:TPA: hypothetical protein ACV5IO_005635 [Pseudomonas aeruginosa]|nr:hypothetical protein [Pseudomonas aeruginosa]MCS8265493.1 hypothetical protein [Pseudomonas aeruginosa]